MKKTALTVTLLSSVLGTLMLYQPAEAADTTYVDQADGKAFVANNQGTTSVTINGITNTDSTVVNPNASGDGSAVTDAENTTKNNGKRVTGLTLTDVPSFDFNNHRSDGKTNWDLGTTSMTTNGYYANGASPFAKAIGLTDSDNAVVVNNLRGDDKGYSIYATASSLYTKNDQKLPVSDLKLTIADGVANTDTNGQLTGSTNTDIYHATKATTTDPNNNSDIKVSDQTSTGTTKATDTIGLVAGYGNKIAAGNDTADGTYASGKTTATLDLSDDNVVPNAAYTGTITYTLQSTIFDK